MFSSAAFRKTAPLYICRIPLSGGVQAMVSIKAETFNQVSNLSKRYSICPSVGIKEDDNGRKNFHEI
jgi:hypothetical protein